MEQEDVKLELGDPEITSMSLMKQLANDDTNTVIDINGEQLIDRTKLFLVVQARNSLKRIIKLTRYSISLSLFQNFLTYCVHMFNSFHFKFVRSLIYIYINTLACGIICCIFSTSCGY